MEGFEQQIACESEQHGLVFEQTALAQTQMGARYPFPLTQEGQHVRGSIPLSRPTQADKTCDITTERFGYNQDYSSYGTTSERTATEMELR